MRGAETHSKGLQAGIEPMAAAAETHPFYMGSLLSPLSHQVPLDGYTILKISVPVDLVTPGVRASNDKCVNNNTPDFKVVITMTHVLYETTGGSNSLSEEQLLYNG